jgi:hypothetical protein
MDPAGASDLHTKRCSLNVSAEDFAVMGATLADRGALMQEQTSELKMDRDRPGRALALTTRNRPSRLRNRSRNTRGRTSSSADQSDHPNPPIPLVIEFALSSDVVPILLGSNLLWSRQLAREAARQLEHRVNFVSASALLIPARFLPLGPPMFDSPRIAS